MNTKKKSSWLSLILALAMMITTSLTGLMPVNGMANTVQAAGETRTIYFSTHNNNETKFGADKGTGTVSIAYGTNDIDNNTWMAMSRIGQDGSGYLYKADVPVSASYFRVNFQDGNYVPGINNNDGDRNNSDTATTLIKINSNGNYVTLKPGESSTEWTDPRNNTIPANETADKVTVLYAQHTYGGVSTASNNGLWAEQRNKTELGLTDAESRTVYFTTLNNKNSDAGNTWDYSDAMYIYQNGTWTEMTRVKEDTKNVNNSSEQYGTIWKAAISASVGTEFRFASKPNQATLAYGVSTTEKTWATNASVTTKIMVTANGYKVERPDGSGAWENCTFTRNASYEDVFYNYGTYEVSGTSYNHGVALYGTLVSVFGPYTTEDVTGTTTGTTVYINDIGSVLTAPLTVTLTAANREDVTKDIELTKDTATGLYTFTVPGLESEDDVTAGEWRYATVKDSSSSATTVFSRCDLTAVSSSKPVYVYGITEVEEDAGLRAVSRWEAIHTGSAQKVDNRLYVGNTGIKSLRIRYGDPKNDVEVSLTTSVDGDYFEIPNDVTTETLLIAGTSDSTASNGSEGIAATYYFYWSDASFDTLTIQDEIAVVDVKHVASNETKTLGDLQNVKSGETKKFILTEDITDNNKTWKISGDVVLDLNGHKITTSTQLFTVADNANLTIRDSAKVTSKKSKESGLSDIDNFVESAALSNYEKWVHLASVTRNNDSITVTYYVTEASPYDNATKSEQATLKGTKDTWYKYEDTVYGRIITTGTPKQIIEVSGKGTFNLEGGALTVGENKDVQHLVLNRGTFNMTGGYLVGNNSTDTNGGGAVYNYSSGSSAGTMTMTGGVIAANSAAKANAGAIYNADGGKLVVSGGDENTYGGVISGNKCDWNKFGGGIYSVGSEVTISGNSYITNNYQPGNCSESDTNNDETQSGGGGIATKKGTFTMDGGNVTGNLAGDSGGGLYIGYYNEGTTYTFSGGYVSENMCYHGEGGGIRISGGSDGKIKGNIYITNNGNLTGAAASQNQAGSTKLSGTWGGGGIFVQTNGKLTIETALITNNYAGGYGGGFAACPTGAAVSVSNTGAAIYGNDALDRNMTTTSNGKNKDESLHNGGYSQAVKDYFKSESHNAKDYFSAGAAAISGAMLGYTTAKWSGYIDNVAVSENKYSMYDTATGNDFIGLTANPSEADKQESTKLSTVVISGNYSYTHGGGVMTNGAVVLGTTPSQEVSYPAVRLTGLKNIIKESADNTDYSNDFTFKLVTAEPQIISQKIALVNQTEVASASVLDGNKFYLDWNLTETECQSSTGFTYYMYEQAGEAGNVTYDDTVYQITGTIKSEQETVGTGNDGHAKLVITHYYVDSLTIKKGAVSSDHTQIIWTELTAGKSKDYVAETQKNYTETITFNKVTFNNCVELPKTEISVHKIWLSNEKYTQEEADAGQIPTGYKVGDYKPLTGEAANTDAYFILYRYTTNPDEREFYKVANDGVTVSWVTDVADASTLGETKTDSNIYNARNLDVYYSYDKNSSTNAVKYTYVIAEKCDNNTYVSFPSEDQSVKISSGGKYYVTIKKDNEITDTNTGEICQTNYTVTNRPETYTLPLTGSNGWNKGSLYLLMLLIAVTAVGIYTVNKLKRKTQVYATKQEENES